MYFLEAHHFFLYVHAYGGFSMSDGIFLLVFERYASVFYPTFRSSKVYKFWFIALICAHIFGLVSYLYLMVTVRTTVSAMTAMSSLTILYVITFILVAVLLCLSKKRYYETLGLVSLAKRFMLSESYELCRSTLPAIIVSSLLNIGYCITTWLLALGYLFQDVFYEYFAFGNVILKLSPFYVNSVVAHNGVQKLDGHSIELFQTQNEYFDQLRSSWS
uniref:Serpentine receptor class gamma n=1 Tax=Caenorhabditis japonica TaxID=281687 RepID=A0A8R1HVI6_CAEJA